MITPLSKRARPLIAGILTALLAPPVFAQQTGRATQQGSRGIAADADVAATTDHRARTARHPQRRSRQAAAQRRAPALRRRSGQVANRTAQGSQWI